MEHAAYSFLWYLENESYLYEVFHRAHRGLKEESDGKASGKLALYFPTNEIAFHCVFLFL